MNRRLNIILNTALYIVLLGLIFTGTIIHFVLPHGSQRHGLSLLGWTRQDWGWLHGWISAAFVVGLLVHLWLHWAWIAHLARGDDKAPPFRRRYGEALLDAGVLGLALAASLPFLLR